MGVVRIQWCLYMGGWVGSQGFVEEECSGIGLDAWGENQGGAEISQEL